jgi:hypothetical protein
MAALEKVVALVEGRADTEPPPEARSARSGRTPAASGRIFVVHGHDDLARESA